VEIDIQPIKCFKKLEVNILQGFGSDYGDNMQPACPQKCNRLGEGAGDVGFFILFCYAPCHCAKQAVRQRKE